MDTALLCATHRMLGEQVRAGRFREDLYYRVNGLAVQLPPLRERTDLPRIVRRLLDGSSHHPAPARITVAPQTMAFLEAYAWPGNIRQLQNVLEVALALLDEDETSILPVHLPEELLQVAGDAPAGLAGRARRPAGPAAAARPRARRRGHPRRARAL